MAVLKQIKFGSKTTPIAQTVVTAASESVLSVNGTNTGLGDDANPSYEVDLRIDNDTLVKSNDANKVLKVGNVPAKQVSVDDIQGIESTDAQSAFQELKEEIDTVSGAAKSYTIVKQTSDLEPNVKEQYKLQQTVGQNSKFVGDTIKIYKDSSLKSVELVDQKLMFTYILADGSESTVGVDVSTFLAESEFKDGLQVNNSEVSVKIDATSEKDSQSTPVDFLTVSENGVKIQGIGAEIDRKINALNASDTASAGQYVSSVSESNGIVSTTKANVSDAVLNGYEKGTDATAIAATDSLKAALSKLENQVDKAKAAATTKVVEGTDVGNNLSIDSATSASDGSTTYTINLTDVASASDLTAEVTRAKNAETAIDSAVGLTKAADPSESRTWTPTTNYGESTTSVKDNMQAIDTQLKTVSDNLAKVQYQVTGTTLEFFGISEKTGA